MVTTQSESRSLVPLTTLTTGTATSSKTCNLFQNKKLNVLIGLKENVFSQIDSENTLPFSI